MENPIALSGEAAAALLLRLDSLLLYRALLDDPVLVTWQSVLRAGIAIDAAAQAEENSPGAEVAARVSALLKAYGCWFEAMAVTGTDWPRYVIALLLLAENPWTSRLAAVEAERLEDALKHYDLGGMATAAREDVMALQAVLPWCGQALAQWVAEQAGLPNPPAAWEPLVQEGDAALDGNAVSQLLGSPSWGGELPILFNHSQTRGIGLWGRYRAFRWEAGELSGIATPDPVQLNQLVGYEHPMQQLVANTERLLKGQPALNVLLYGSRGAGKSSLVKALVHEYGDRGLRLIEVAKAELYALPKIVERLRGVAQKFILFVDDLSFDADDEAFKSLKVVLEGSATARPENVVVYATSNRRHLVREIFDDRPRPRDADEIHSWDTTQEKLSFSDRFGLTLTFEPANQDRYLEIVNHLVAQAGIVIDAEDLDFRARQWATRHNGRSGRTARQFVDWLQGESL